MGEPGCCTRYRSMDFPTLLLGSRHVGQPQRAGCAPCRRRLASLGGNCSSAPAQLGGVVRSCSLLTDKQRRGGYLLLLFFCGHPSFYLPLKSFVLSNSWSFTSQNQDMTITGIIAEGSRYFDQLGFLTECLNLSTRPSLVLGLRRSLPDHVLVVFVSTFFSTIRHTSRHVVSRWHAFANSCIFLVALYI